MCKYHDSNNRYFFTSRVFPFPSTLIISSNQFFCGARIKTVAIRLCISNKHKRRSSTSGTKKKSEFRKRNIIIDQCWLWIVVSQYCFVFFCYACSRFVKSPCTLRVERYRVYCSNSGSCCCCLASSFIVYLFFIAYVLLIKKMWNNWFVAVFYFLSLCACYLCTISKRLQFGRRIFKYHAPHFHNNHFVLCFNVDRTIDDHYYEMMCI